MSERLKEVERATLHERVLPVLPLGNVRPGESRVLSVEQDSADLIIHIRRALVYAVKVRYAVVAGLDYRILTREHEVCHRDAVYSETPSVLEVHFAVAVRVLSRLFEVFAEFVKRPLTALHRVVDVVEPDVGGDILILEKHVMTLAEHEADVTEKREALAAEGQAVARVLVPPDLVADAGEVGDVAEVTVLYYRSGDM